MGFRCEAVETSINTTERFLPIIIIKKFFFFTKILMSKKDKRPAFSFSNEKFMLQCVEDKYFLNFDQERAKQYKYIINIPSIKDRY